MTLISLAWLMIALPALGALGLLITGSFFNRRGHWVGVAASCAAFGVAVAVFCWMMAQPEGARALRVPLFDWIDAGTWRVDVGLLIDPLSIVFALLITGVGSVIHVYSVGYMAHDPNRRKFFAFLNLFIAAMLILVLADNYLVLFVGWEGVGLASYLLIGFWQQRPSAAAAAKKAFVMNRVGDLGMSMAIMAMLALVGSSAFADVNAAVAAGKVDQIWLTAIGVLLLVGACGKSAQVPLQAWLLDAMEGPTPVSALIHAATMVTAGVYLVVRSHAIFSSSATATTCVVVVGTVTLLVGAWIGCSKDDIKKVLAGSTMSQIGYMVLAAGIGPAGYALAIFHLLTHGFFKANMFLGAGSVMHAMGDDVNMRHFGALRKVLPVTFLTFAMGYLAIIGFPYFSGYFSKDSIIEAAFEWGPVVGVLAMLGAGVTAFYMTRLMLMTFFGEKRWRDGVHPHESPKIMTIPLIILAAFSVGIGGVLNAWIQDWLAPTVGAHVHEAEWAPSLLGLATIAVVAAGVFVAWLVFGRRPIPDDQPASRNPLTVAGRHDVFGDAVNEVLVVKPVMGAASVAAAADVRAIDGGVGVLAKAFRGLSRQGRKLQTGQVRSYAVVMLAGAVFFGLLLILSQLV